MTDDDTLRRRPDVVEARISERELVLLGPDSHDYFGLDPVAADVWTRLAQPMTFGALVADLAGAYDAAPATIAEDVAPMIEDLVAGGLLLRDAAAA